MRATALEIDPINEAAPSWSREIAEPSNKHSRIKAINSTYKAIYVIKTPTLPNSPNRLHPQSPPVLHPHTGTHQPHSLKRPLLLPLSPRKHPLQHRLSPSPPSRPLFSPSTSHPTISQPHFIQTQPSPAPPPLRPSFHLVAFPSPGRLSASLNSGSCFRNSSQRSSKAKTPLPSLSRCDLVRKIRGTLSQC